MSKRLTNQSRLNWGQAKEKFSSAARIRPPAGEELPLF